MDEKKETQPEEKQEEPVKPEDDGVLPTTTPLIDIANAAAERMEKANEETGKLLSRQEALEQRRALGGRSEAGITPVKQEETDEDIANKFDKGELDLLAQ